MGNETLVSVVLPMCNAEQYLRPCIESILAQSHRSFELIVVDDGSKDASAAIASEYAARDGRMKVLRLEKSGLSRALNAGIAAARGEYVARMDADDIAHPDRLLKQVEYLRARPECVLLGTAVDVIAAAGESLGTRYFADAHEEIVDELLRGTFAICHPTVMMRRCAVVAAGGYDETLYPSDDFALWLAMSEAGALSNLREPLLQYRRHERSVTVVNRATAHALTMRITNAARAARGLPPVRGRAPVSPSSIEARYHFDCARFALTGGSRVTALRHLAATIRCAPAWVEAYAVLFACLLPRPLLFAALAIRARLRAPQGRRGAGAQGLASVPVSEP